MLARSIALAVALATAWSQPARADRDARVPSPSWADRDDADVTLPSPSWSYLWDGGAVAFGWLPLAVTLGSRAFVEPPKTPRLFSASEGGAEFNGDTVPEATVALYGLLAGGLVLLSPSDARWHHAKGFSEAIASTLALTEVAKNAVGRHRPHWEDNDVTDDRRSFFSGHSSVTWMASTYLSLYLNAHVFDRWRPKAQRFAWWETVPYAALLAGSSAVSWSRIRDNRHHKSDVMTGAVVGVGVGSAFYWWQERRYRKAKQRLRDLRRLRELSATQPVTDP